MAWATVSPRGFELVRGVISTHRSRSGDVRGFCGQCGTQLIFLSRDKADMETDFTIASLDDPGLVRPLDDVWTRSRIGWVPFISDGPRYGKARP